MEALGGAASIIGVVSLALQVCEQLKKVQDFWQSVKDAPDDIAQISTEISLFLTWLTVIANNYQRHGFKHGSPDEVAATETLKLCLATVHDMNDGVKDLECGLSKGLLSRRWASVKFVFRKDKIEKLMKQIERMKTLLIIVQTCYIGEMQEAGFRYLSLSLRPKDPALQATSNGKPLDKSTIASINEGLVAETQLLQSTPNPPAGLVPFNPTLSLQSPRRLKHRTTQQERVYNFGLAMLRLITTEQESNLLEESGNERRIPARRTRYDLRIAQWLLSRGFSWQSFGMYSSWQYSFRTFRYIPKDALILDFCIAGDLANVQRMFDKGLASPFDRVAWRYEDWSLLHFSIAHGHAQLCKFLIECGLGHGSASGMSMSPILSLVGSQIQNWTASNPAAHLDTLRIMINDGQYDPMEQASYTSVMHCFKGSPAVYRWLLDQEKFLIDFEQKIFGVMTIATTLMSSNQLSTSECLEAVIAHGSGLNDYADPSHGISLADGAVFDLRRLAENLDFPKRIRVLWDAGADFHTPKSDNFHGTTLDTLLYSLTIDVEDNTTKFKECGGERQSIPTPPVMSTRAVIEYDRLENTSAIKYRPRISRSLWRTWYPEYELSPLETMQRWLDAWMEVLLEAGLDIADYCRIEDQLHPEGLVHHSTEESGIEARVHFEYGDHVSGCRIHVTEIWVYDDSEDETTTSTEASRMPGSWDFDDA